MKSIFRIIAPKIDNNFVIIINIIILFLFLFLNIPEQVLANTPFKNSMLLSMADSLLSYKNYDEAITEYKRFIFFHPNSKKLDYIYLKIGSCYQRIGNFKKSVNAFNTSIKLTKDDSLKNENRISIAVSSIANANYDIALKELQKVVLNNNNSIIKKKAHFLITIAYIYKKNWDAASNVFQFFKNDSSYNSASFIFRIDSILNKGNELKFKSTQISEILSTFLPGLGQFYNGFYKDAFNAFSLNGLNFYITYYLINQDLYIKAGLYFIYFGVRYYNGNRYHARQGAIDFNNELINKHKKQVLDSLLEFSKYL
jgi:predicted negative regulator of RcsB-dependent stress response